MILIPFETSIVLKNRFSEQGYKLPTLHDHAGPAPPTHRVHAASSTAQRRCRILSWHVFSTTADPKMFSKTHNRNWFWFLFCIHHTPKAPNGTCTRQAIFFFWTHVTELHGESDSELSEGSHVKFTVRGTHVNPKLNSHMTKSGQIWLAKKTDCADSDSQTHLWLDKKQGMRWLRLASSEVTR